MRFIWFLETVDEWIIQRLESFCHKTQKTMGLDSGHWERGCLLVEIALLLASMAVATGLPNIPAWGKGIVSFVFGLNVLLSIGRLVASRKRKKINSAGTAVIPRARVSSRWSRAYWMIVCSMIFPIFSYAPEQLWIVFSGLAACFEAVIDLPPGESRLRKAVKSLRGKLAAVPQPVGVKA